MKNFTLKSLVVFSVLLAAAGFGCARQPSPAPPAGPRPAVFDNLTPAQAAQKINFVSSNVIVMRQTFSGAGAKLAAGMNLGSEATRDVVIRRFAPAVRVDIEWKMTTEIKKPDPKDKTKTVSETRQTTGVILDGNLQSAHELYPPVYWPEGEKGALSTGILWLSQDVYENLTRIKNSSFYFGLVNPELYAPLTGSAGSDFKKGLAKLESEAKAVLVNHDIYLARAEDQPSDYTLKVNGRDVKVEVLKVKSWFGEMLVLNNKQNPLVLKVTIDKLADGSLQGFYDYQITELRDLTE